MRNELLDMPTLARPVADRAPPARRSRRRRSNACARAKDREARLCRRCDGRGARRVARRGEVRFVQRLVGRPDEHAVERHRVPQQRASASRSSDRTPTAPQLTELAPSTPAVERLDSPRHSLRWKWRTHRRSGSHFGTRDTRADQLAETELISLVTPLGALCACVEPRSIVSSSAAASSALPTHARSAHHSRSLRLSSCALACGLPGLCGLLDSRRGPSARCSELDFTIRAAFALRPSAAHHAVQD